MLAKAIEVLINEYMSSFVEAVSGKYNLPKEELAALWVESQKTKPVKRSKSSPLVSSGKPKRLNGYMMFCKEHRPALQEKGLSFKEVSKELSAKWKLLSEEEKKVFSAPRENEVGVATPTDDVSPFTWKSREVVEKKTTKKNPKKKDLPEESGEETHDEREEEVEKKTTKKNPKKKDLPEESGEETHDEREEEVEKKTTKKNPKKTLSHEDVSGDETDDKKTKRPKAIKIQATSKAPSDLTDEETELWEKFNKMKKDELKEECEKSGIKTGSKAEMVIGLVKVHSALNSSLGDMYPGLTDIHPFADDEM